MPTIRDSRPDDAVATEVVVTAAFAGSAEARLVSALRGRDEVFELVATLDEQIVGHVLFSPVTVPGLAPGLRATGLAPLCVEPTHHGEGIGSALTRAGLEACRARGIAAVVLLGHPNYYPRFGFRQASEFGLHCKWPSQPPAFQALELRPGALHGCSGLVHYDAPFAELD